MKSVLCHYARIDKYLVPDAIAMRGEEVIESYLLEKGDAEPYESETRNWEIVEILD